MTTEEQIILLRSSWIQAAGVLGFKIVSPYTIQMDDGKEEEVFAFIPDYGRPNGTILGLFYPKQPPNKKFSSWANKNNAFCSFINPKAYQTYDEARFKETLIDWGYYGDSANKPDWIR